MDTPNRNWPHRDDLVRQIAHAIRASDGYRRAADEWFVDEDVIAADVVKLLVTLPMADMLRGLAEETDRLREEE
jgi:hypothetical protein